MTEAVISRNQSGFYMITAYVMKELNLINIGNETRKLSLIINSICIQVNLQNVQGTYFCGFIETD